MDVASGFQAENPQVVESIQGLIGYLKELVRSGYRAVLDLKNYEKVEWLGTLPAGITVRTPDGDSSDSLILRIDFEPKSRAPEPPPELAEHLDSAQLQDPMSPVAELRLAERSAQVAVRDEHAHTSDHPDDEREALYRVWRDQWQRWAVRESQLRARQQVYSHLASIYRHLSQLDDELEAVLAVGLASWKPAPGVRIMRHLVTRRVKITIDRATQRLEVRLDPDAMLRLEDRDFLLDKPGYSEDRAAVMQEAIAAGEQHPLAAIVQADIVEEWCRRALEQASEFTVDWIPPRPGSQDEVARVSWSPAVILRKRDRNAWVDYYERIEKALNGPDPAIPLGLAQLIAPLDEIEREMWGGGPAVSSGSATPRILGEDPLFPLATNQAQRDILDKLERDACVVVQGPPGTGKTHTIANLATALLAQGQRVLVTSQKDQALRVLRNQLPAEVRELCVLLTTRSSSDASSDLERTLTAFADRLTSNETSSIDKHILDLSEQRDRLRRRISMLEDAIWRLRIAETVEHHDVATGYEGSAADISTLVQRRRSKLDWLPRPVPQSADQALLLLPPLQDLLRSGSPKRAASLAEWVPDRLPDLRSFTAKAERLQILRAQAGTGHDDWADQLAHLDSTLLHVMEQAVEGANRALHRMGLDQDPSQWSVTDWRTKVLNDRVSGMRTTLWDRVARASIGVIADQQAIEVSRLQVRTPDLPIAELELFRRDAKEWQEYLAGGGRVKKRSVKELRARTEPRLAQCAVNGAVPTSPQEIAAVIMHLDAILTISQVARTYSDVGVKPVEGSLAVVQDEYVRRIELLEAASDYRQASEGIKQNLGVAGIHILIETPQDLRRFASALAGCRAYAEQAQLERGFEALAQELYDSAGGAVSGLVSGLVKAVRDLDVAVYAALAKEVDLLHRQRHDEMECRRLRAELTELYPALVVLLDGTLSEPRWDDLAGIQAALQWAKAADFLEHGEPPEREQELSSDLRAAELKLLDTTGKLAAAKAWHHAATRTTAAQQSALQSFKLAVGRLGKGTGKYAGRHRTAIRSAMTTARSAVPAWVMPINQVVETLPPIANSFDVVIVDEASQVGVEALFLQWLAPRVIVVGDDKQCAPGPGGYGTHDAHLRRLDELLSDVPVHLRDTLAPGSNLYEAMTPRASALIHLVEHFRCMPEIIGWSARQFYDGLEPVRQFGADRLPPLRVIQVEGAYTEGRNQEIRNPVEAKRIVDELRTLFADPNYRGRKFGVITLQGSGQVRLLENLIDAEFEETAIEERGLRVGVPAAFQGDERDVILLSMVIAAPAVARTSRDDQRRYNVAASRAKDQMILFISIDPSRLKEVDLRSSLVRYMQSPPPALTPSPVDPALVRSDELSHPFDSLFEQRVYLKIVERGYYVLPQLAAGQRRIDLVVIGASARLAVECDGDYWHGDRERQHEDLRRERELVRVGWKFWRVRESVFNFDPDKALEPLWDRLATSGIEPDVTPVWTSPSSDTPAWEPIDLPDDDAEETDDAEELQ